MIHKFFLFLFTVIASVTVARAADLKITPLYDVKSRQPNTLLPFRISGSSFVGGSLKGVQVSTTGASCKIVQDPFHRDIVLLKCPSETSAQLRFTVVSETTEISVNYGPITIAYPPSQTGPIAPTAQIDLDHRKGSSLFSAYCVQCHNPPKDKANRTAAYIRSVINSEKKMNGSQVGTRENPLGGVDLRHLTDNDLKLIEYFLKNPEK